MIETENLFENLKMLYNLLHILDTYINNKF